MANDIDAINLMNENTKLKEENKQLLKALKEAKRMLKHYGSRDAAGMAIIDKALGNNK